VTPRSHFTKYTFTGEGWKTRVPDVLDADLRHCNWNASVTRLLRGPYRGRLWASWGQIDRNHAVTVHAKYSDDDGRVWIPWGRGAELPGGSRGWWDDTLSYHWRSPEGRWEGPVTLVPEFMIDEIKSLPGFSVPRYSPPNFVPLAWSDAGEGVVKLLRVPIPPRRPRTPQDPD
jgi:hypothetical protein